MDDESIKAVANATNRIAEAVSIPEEVKTELLIPSAGVIGQRLRRLFNRNQFTKRAEEIIEEKYLIDLADRTEKYFRNHENPTLDEAKDYLLRKQIDDSRFSIDNDQMRELFAKLISKTADKNTNENITPYFSNVLSNLSPESAKLLLCISKNSYTPIIEIADPRKILVQINKRQESIQETKSAINQLESLGLLELDTLHLTEQNDQLNQYASNILNLNSEQYRIGQITLTEFGIAFVKSVN